MASLRPTWGLRDPAAPGPSPGWWGPAAKSVAAAATATALTAACLSLAPRVALWGAPPAASAGATARLAPPRTSRPTLLAPPTPRPGLAPRHTLTRPQYAAAPGQPQPHGAAPSLASAGQGGLRAGGAVLFPAAALSAAWLGAAWAMAVVSGRKRKKPQKGVPTFSSGKKKTRKQERVPIMPFSPKAFIYLTLKRHHIVIYSKSYCPYSLQVKKLLAKYDFEFDILVVEIDELWKGKEVQEELLAMTGQPTVPNVFVKGEHVGGVDECQAAEESGRMKALLELPWDTEERITMLATTGAKVPPKEFVQQSIAAHDAVIFSKTYCPFCAKTKALFEEVGKGYDVLTVELDAMPGGEAVQQALLELTGQRTVPNVFVKGQHVGGNDDSQAAAQSGRLQALLKGERPSVAMLATSGAKPAPKEFVQQSIAAHDAVIFSKTYCPFCAKTKALFEEVGKGYDVLTVELDAMPGGEAVQQALLELTGQRTVPNVFVKGQHVGGNDDSQAAARSGRLQALLTGERPSVAMLATSGESSPPTPTPALAQPVICCWLRNDLRLHDNAVLARALQLLASGKYTAALPVYVFDPRPLGKSAFGSPKTGPFRAPFLLESVLDLKQSLWAAGSNLLIQIGKPEEILPLLLPPGSVVLFQEEVTSEERTVEAAVEAVLPPGVTLERVWGATLYHPRDLKFAPTLEDLPDVFTPFKERVERECTVRRLLPTVPRGGLPLPDPCDALDFSFTPGLGDLPLPPEVSAPTSDERAVLPFRGGEAAALARLQYYLWDSDRVATYFDTRNGMLGGDYSTKLSPWLALGCLSPRHVYYEVKQYERKRKANKSTYWVIFELTWRDFYRFFARKHGNAIFRPGGVLGRPTEWRRDSEALRRWREGRTGVPFVDANMRELRATGWMSNRGRQNVASYLALDLNLGWRLGAAHFEALLLDYDVCSNWGNWVAAAGLTGGRINRFNLPKQSRDYDPQGDYIRQWVPELRRVPADFIHEPHRMTPEQQARYGVRIGDDYPAPLPTAQPPRATSPPPSRWPAPSAGMGERPPSIGRGRR